MGTFREKGGKEFDEGKDAKGRQRNRRIAQRWS